MLKTKLVTFENNGNQATLTLSESSGRMSVRRGFMAIQGSEANKAALENGEEPIDALFIRSTMYPDMLGAVVLSEGMIMPKTPDEFIALIDSLPETVVQEWNAAVYELNPHWRATDNTDEEKKSD